MPGNPGEATLTPKELAADYWEGTMRAAPRWATQLGDHRFDDRLEDPSPEAKRADGSRLEALRAAIGQTEARDAEERLTLASLRVQVESDLDSLSCAMEEWTVDPLEGPQVDLLDLATFQPAATVEEGQALLARWRAIGPYLDAFTANLARGLATGRVATRDAVTQVLAQLDELLGKPVEEWSLLHPLATPHEDWPAGETRRLREGVTAAVRDLVRPGFERLRALLRDSILPRARGPERPGLASVEGGEAAYRKLVRIYTSLEVSPGELHETGQAEVERARRAIESLGVLGARTLLDVRRRIASDPALFFATRDEVLGRAEETLRRAEAAAPRFFGRRPRTPCVVLPVEPHEEKLATIAYYLAGDGVRPGAYMVNTSLPETRPRHEAQVLAFHEAVPGHHFQLAIAQEIPGMPEFRKHAGVTAYVEGWALYAERLADEMGLYDSELDRLGMFAFDAWRACRLVVDTGLHALGWSRQRAIDFMAANTLVPDENLAGEIDRYVVWPGQALAYKVGQLEILRLRDAARARLGAAFDLREFHDRVLEVGPVSLSLLRERIEGWVGAAPD
jgi:uncharacterized protein (DUF885 family)